MLDGAIKDLNIDVENSYMIGDTLVDIDWIQCRVNIILKLDMEWSS